MSTLTPGQYTNPQVEEEILRLVRLMEDKNDEMPLMIKQMSEADVAYESGFARARMQYKAEHAHLTGREKPTEGDVEAHAAIVTVELRQAHIYTEEILRAQHLAIRSLQTAISALQTLASNLREEFKTANFGR